MPPLATGRPAAHNPRWAVAAQVVSAVRRRHGMDVTAIGVHGPLAHGDDTEASAVDLIVVTHRPGAGPPPGARRVAGVIVDVGVIGAEEYLRYARTLTTSWPLAADQYITTRALHDPDGWLPSLRDAHLARLAQTSAQTFAALAREAWCRAKIAHAKARRLTEWHELDPAMLVLGEARLGVALVEGLLTRTYFRDSADAVRRAGVAAAGMVDLGRRLAEQAQELARRGRPVDAEVDDLLA